MQRLARVSWVIGCWKSDKQARGVGGHCINDSFKFLRISLDETTANMYFLATFYCSEQLKSTVLKYQETRTTQDQFEAEIAKKK